LIQNVCYKRTFEACKPTKISVMWQYIPDTQYSVREEIKRVDEWHVGKNHL